MKLALGLSLILLAAPALAFQEPDAFRGIKWETPFTEAKALIDREQGAACTEGITARTCSAQITIGTIPASVVYYFTQGEDRFFMATLTFEPTRYAALGEIFVERYGAPTNRQTTDRRNPSGRLFINEISTWVGERVAVDIRRYGSTLDDGRATIGLKAAIERNREELQKALKKAKDDL
jgi:hypothetical protein